MDEKKKNRDENTHNKMWNVSTDVVLNLCITYTINPLVVFASLFFFCILLCHTHTKLIRKITGSWRATGTHTTKKRRKSNTTSQIASLVLFNDDDFFFLLTPHSSTINIARIVIFVCVAYLSAVNTQICVRLLLISRYEVKHSRFFFFFEDGFSIQSNWNGRTNTSLPLWYWNAFMLVS